MNKQRWKNIVLVAALFHGAAGELTAATHTVTSLNDSGPGTLRDAITNASPGDTINFGVTGNIVLTNELVIGTNLTINGPGVTNLTVSVDLDTNVYSRIFRFTGGTNSVSELTMAYAFSKLAEKGGAISNGSALTLRNCLLASNVARVASGGAIYNSGSLTVSNCTFTGNIGIAGGAIDNRGLATITTSVFSRNSTDADGDGGGIQNFFGGIMTIRDSLLSSNVAEYGRADAANFPQRFVCTL